MDKIVEIVTVAAIFGFGLFFFILVIQLMEKKEITDKLSLVKGLTATQKLITANYCLAFDELNRKFCIISRGGKTLTPFLLEYKDICQRRPGIALKLAART